MQKNMGKVSAGVSVRQGKRRLTLILCAVMVCCAILACITGVLKPVRSAEVKAVDIGSITEADYAEIKELYASIALSAEKKSGKARAAGTVDSYASLKSTLEEIPEKRLTAKELAADGEDIQVTIGGITWDLVYVSEATNGDVIATMWYSGTAEKSSYANNWYANNTTYKYPGDMYGTSYIRSGLTGSSYAESANVTELTSGTMSATWQSFIEEFGDYITTPSQVGWQLTEASPTWLAENYDIPNESAGIVAGASFYNDENINKDYTQKSGYFDWSGDKLWLPGLGEVGASGNGVGIWDVTDGQYTRLGSTDKYWLRGSWYKTGADFAYSMQGDNLTITRTDEELLVRPAFHLNMRATVQGIGDEAIAPDATPEAQGTNGGNDGLTYSGAMQTAIRYNPSKAELYSLSRTDVSGNIQSISAGDSADWFALSDGKLSVLHAGEYTAEFKLAEGITEWSDGETGIKSVNFKVNRYELKTDWTVTGVQGDADSGYYWVYDGLSHGMSAEVSANQSIDISVHPAISVRYQVSGGTSWSEETPVNIGSYTARAILTTENNDYTVTDTREFKIEKRALDIIWSAVGAQNTETNGLHWIYDGTIHKVTASLDGVATSDDTAEKLSLSVKYAPKGVGAQPADTVDGLEPIDAGEYTAIAELTGASKDNYYLKDETGLEISYAAQPYKITQREVNVNWSKNPETGTYVWVYSGYEDRTTFVPTIETQSESSTGDTGVISGQSLTIGVTYATVISGAAGEYDSQVRVDAGKYKAQATQSDKNYVLTNAVLDYEITKREVKVEWTGTGAYGTDGDIQLWRYDGESHVPTAKASLPATGAGSVSGGDDLTEQLLVTGAATEVTALSEYSARGYYIAEASFKADAPEKSRNNYALINATRKFRIDKGLISGVTWYRPDTESADGKVELTDSPSYLWGEVKGAGPGLTAEAKATVKTTDGEREVKFILTVTYPGASYADGESWPVNERAGYKATAALTGSSTDGSENANRFELKQKDLDGAIKTCDSFTFYVLPKAGDVEEITVSWVVFTDGNNYVELSELLGNSGVGLSTGGQVSETDGKYAFVYNGKPQSPTAIYKYATPNAQGETYEILPLGSDSRKTVVGDWTAYVDTSTGYQYKSGTTECDYKITPLTIKLNWGTLSFDYNGKERKPRPTLDSDYIAAQESWYRSIIAGMQVTGGELSKITANGATDAGEYKTTPNLSENFAYADGTGEALMTINPFAIVASSVVWTFDDLAKNDTKGTDGTVTDEEAWYWNFDGNSHAPTPSLSVSLDGVTTITLKLSTVGATSELGEHYAYAWLDTSDTQNKNFKLIKSKENPEPTQSSRKFTIAQIEIHKIYWAGAEVTAGDGYTGATIEIAGVTYQLSENGAAELSNRFDGGEWSPKAYYRVGEGYAELPVEGGMRNVGTYVARVSGEYNLRDESGKPISRECGFKILPYEITVTWQQPETGDILKMEYTGTLQRPEVELSEGIVGEKITYTVTGFVDAGNYTAEITFTNPNYTYKGNAGEANVCEFIITKKSITVGWAYTGNAGINGEVPYWQYNSSAPAITIESVDGEQGQSVTMPNFGEVTFTFGYTGLVGSVGTHTAKAVITGATLDGAEIDKDNFEISVESNAQNYEITVYEITVVWTGNAETGKFEWSYDGTAHAPTAEYTLWDGTTRTATVAGERIIAGEYTARAVLPEELIGNCVFAEITTEIAGTETARSSGECDFKITKCKVTVKWEFAEAEYKSGEWELEYDGKPHAPKAYDEKTNTELSVTGAVADAGNRHIASAILPDAANFEFATDSDSYCYFTIKVKTVRIKWVDDSGDNTPAFSWYYSPNVERAPKAVITNADGSEFKIDGKLVYAIVSGGAMHAGKYLATAEIVSSNYAFPAGETFTQKFEILKLELTDEDFWWTDADKLKDGWYVYEYNGEAQHPYAETRNFTEFAYAYTAVADDKTPIGGELSGITDSGKYKVTINIVNNNDYSIPDGKETVYVKIDPKTVTVTWSAKPVVYNGANQKPEAYYTDVNGTEYPLKVTVAETEYKYCGAKYHATASFIEATVKNYVLDATTTTKEYEISRRSLTVTWGQRDFYYDNSGHYVTSEVDIGDAVISDFIDENGLPVMGLSYVILDKDGNVIKDKNGVPVQEVISADEYKMSLMLTGPESVIKNYELNDTDDSDSYQAFTIHRRILVVTADDKEVKYGEDAPVFTATYGEKTEVEGAEKIIHGLIGAEEADIPGLIVNGRRPWLDSVYVPGCVPDEAGYDINIDTAMLAAILPNYTLVDEDGNSTCHIGKLYVKATETTVIWYGDRAVGDPNFEYDGKEHKPDAYLYKNPDKLEVVYVDKDGKELKDFKAVNAGTYYVKAIAPEGVEITERQTISYEIKPREILININRVEVTYGDREVSADGSDILTDDELKTLWNYATDKQAVKGEELGIYFSWNVKDSIKNGFLNAGTYYIEGRYNDDPNYKLIFEGVDNADAEPDKKQFGLYVVNKADIRDESKQGTEWFYEESVIEKYEKYFIRIEDKVTDEETGTESYEFVKFAGDQTAQASFAYSKPYLVGRDEIPNPDENESYPNLDKNNTGISDKGIWIINYKIEIPNHNTYYGRWTVLIKLAEEYVIVIFVKPYEIEYGADIPENLTEQLVDGGYVEISGAVTDKEYFKQIAEAYIPLGYNKYVTNRTKVGAYNPCFRLTVERGDDEPELDVIYRKNNHDEDSNLGMYVIVPRQITVVWGPTEFTYDKAPHVPIPVLGHWINEELFVLEGIENGKVYETTDAGATVRITVTTEGNFKSTGGHKIMLTIDDPNYVLAAGDAVQVISIKGTVPWWLIFMLGALAATAITILITLIIKLRHRNATIAEGISDEEGFYDPLYTPDDAGFDDPISVPDDGFDYDNMWNDYIS